mgnify:CR=1 FL=1
MCERQLFTQFLGQQVLQALENGVCMYPKLEGRFPQVAGVSFAFDPTKPPGQRVDPSFVRIGDEYLNLDQYYRLATKSYMHSGCDGYVMLKDAEILVNLFTNTRKKFKEEISRWTKASVPSWV